MALKITDDCISCGSCEAECPVGAITEGEEIYYIDPNACMECKGHFNEPACVSVCPSDAIIPG